MRTAAKQRKPRNERRQLDPAARLAATDEILQVMYWLRSENIAQEIAPGDLAQWVALEAPQIESLLIQLLGRNLAERVIVDSGAQEGVPRFRLTNAGEREGHRRFTDEFAEFIKPRHFEHSDPDCDCENVSRFSISLKKGLFRQLDDMIKEKGYENRSLAIADMIRDHLVAHRQEIGVTDAVGTIMIAYEPRDARVRRKLGELQDKYVEVIVSTMHVQSDPQNAMEVLVVRGKTSAIKALADRLIGAKGVKHGKLSLTATPSELPS